MANILAQNSIRYNLDTLKTETHALIVMKAGHFLDCTQATSINGFILNYSQPANTRIAFLFTTGDTVDNSQMYAEGTTHGGAISQDTARGAWFKLNSGGYAEIVNTQSLDYESVINEGNTPQELAQILSIPAFKGYRVRVAIALLSTDSNAAPSVSLLIRAQNNTQQTIKTEYSPLFEFGDNAQIVNIIADTESENSGEVLIHGDININESGNWELINSLAGKTAKTLQLRATLTAPTIGTSTAKVNKVSIIHSTGTGIINGDGVCEIVSKTHNWYKPVKHCRVVVKHAPFDESSMKVYASFRPQPVICQNETLGTGDDRLHTYQLRNPHGINLESVKVYYDGEQIFSGYEVNCEVGRITCTPPVGVLVTCDYEFGWSNENWQELNFQQLTRKPDYDESEYYLRVDEAGYICTLKIALHMKTGSTTGEIIGKGTGQEKTFKLAHRVLDGEINIFSNNQALNDKNFYILDDPQYVKIAAPNGTTLKTNYSWVSETPVIYEFYSIFSE